MTQRTIALIHVHAWRLWRLGLRVQRHSIAVAEHAARRGVATDPSRAGHGKVAA